MTKHKATKAAPAKPHHEDLAAPLVPEEAAGPKNMSLPADTSQSGESTFERHVRLREGKCHSYRFTPELLPTRITDVACSLPMGHAGDHDAGGGTTWPDGPEHGTRPDGFKHGEEPAEAASHKKPAKTPSKPPPKPASHPPPPPSPNPSPRPAKPGLVTPSVESDDLETSVVEPETAEARRQRLMVLGIGATVEHQAPPPAPAFHTPQHAKRHGYTRAKVLEPVSARGRRYEPGAEEYFLDTEIAGAPHCFEIL